MKKPTFRIPLWLQGFVIVSLLFALAAIIARMIVGPPDLLVVECVPGHEDHGDYHKFVVKSDGSARLYQGAAGSRGEFTMLHPRDVGEVVAICNRMAEGKSMDDSILVGFPHVTVSARGTRFGAIRSLYFSVGPGAGGFRWVFDRRPAEDDLLRHPEIRNDISKLKELLELYGLR